VNSAFDSFWREVRHALHRLPVWQPGTPMELGDVGTIDENGWTKETELRSLRIPFEVEPPGQPTRIEYVSSNGATLTSKLGATPTGVPGVDLDVGFSVEFSREGALVLRAEAARVLRIADTHRISTEVLRRYATGEWPRSWIVVTEVTEGTSVLVLLSGSSKATASVDVGAAIGVLGAVSGQADISFHVARSTDLAASFATAGPTALLWRGGHVDDPWYARPRWGTRGVTDDAAPVPPPDGGPAPRGRDEPERDESVGEPDFVEMESFGDLPSGG